jgi:hypothetical protein
MVHPQDRARFLQSGRGGHHRKIRRRIHRATGRVTDGFVGSPAGDAGGAPPWLVGIAQDITSRKHAEQEIAKHLAEAEAARAEADALRKATLTLTQNLRMDELLDTLLQTLLTIVPYDSACVLLTDTEGSFLVARQMPRETNRKNIVIWK